MSDSLIAPASSPEKSPRSAQGMSPAAIATLVNSIMLASAASAHAAEPVMQLAAADTVNLDKITVQEEQAKPLSSPKFTQPLTDTPQTLVVIPSTMIEQQGANSLSDVLRNTPGITFAAGEGGNVASGDSFFMRGFDTSGSIFVDGVRDSAAITRDTYNIESVEIAKGPAGADNGRGGASGYVNLVTKTPRNENFTNVSAAYATADGFDNHASRVTLDTNQALSQSPLPGTALRLNAMWQDGGVPGRDIVENSSWGLSPSLALGLGTPTRALVSASITKQDNIPDSGLPSVGFRDELFLDKAGADTTLYPTSSPVAQDISEKFYGYAAEDYEDVESRAIVVRLEHDFTNGLQLSNQTKLADTKRDALTGYIQSATSYTPASGLVTPRHLRSVTDNEILSNQTNLVLSFETAALKHDVSAGLDLSRETQFVPTYTAVNGSATSVTNPDPSRSSGALPSLAANSPYTEARIDSAAVYAFDTVHLSEKLLLNLSGRLERYKNDYTTLAAATAAPTVLSASDDLFTWKTGLVYKPAAAGSLYAAYGNTSTPPGTSFTLSSTAGNANSPSVRPQKAHNYELGAKWDLFEKRLSTSLALYRSENTNISRNIGTTAAPEIVYDSSQISEGIEFGVSGKITKDWFLFGGLGYIDTETESQVSTTNGAALRFTPRLSGNLWTTYALAKGLTVGSGVQYTETVTRSTTLAVAGSSTNTTDTYTIVNVPSYWLLNLFAEYEINAHLSLRLNADNVADEDYYRLNNNGGRYYPGQARSYTLTAVAKF